MSSKSLANPPESGERPALGASEAGRLLAGLHDTPDPIVGALSFAPSVTAQHRFDTHLVLRALANALLHGDGAALLDRLPDICIMVEGPPLADYVQAIKALSAEAKSREEELARVKRAGLDPTRAVTALDRHYRLMPPYLWQFDPNFRSLQVRYVRGRLLAKEKTGPLHVAAEFILAVRAFGQRQKPGESRAEAQARILAWLEGRLARAGR
jgi:hypothetical protein